MGAVDEVWGGVDVLIALFVEGGPVGYAAEEGSDVDKVEVVFLVEPGLGEVVDFEADVWRDHGGLGGTEVRSEYLDLLEWCHGLFVAYLYAPRPMGIYPQSRCWFRVSLSVDMRERETDIAQIPDWSAYAFVDQGVPCIPVPVPRSKTC